MSNGVVPVLGSQLPSLGRWALCLAEKSGAWASLKLTCHSRPLTARLHKRVK